MLTIYCLKVGGSKYIGSTKNLASRLSLHKSQCKAFSNRKVYKKILEEGWEKVECQPLYVSNYHNCTQALQLEQLYINAMKPDLNERRAVRDEETRKEYKANFYRKLPKYFCECCHKYISKYNYKTHTQTKKYLKWKEQQVQDGQDGYPCQ